MKKTSKPQTTAKSERQTYDTLIRFRGTPELEHGLRRVAKSRGMLFAEFMRAEARQLIAADIQANRQAILAR